MKLIKIVIAVIWGCLLYTPGFTQHATMIHEGEITFEKRVNTYAILNEYYNDRGNAMNSFSQQYKASHAQFKITRFKLLFNDDISYYAPASDTENASNPFLGAFAGSNIVYTNLKKKIFTARKNVLGDQYVISDSNRRIHWKLTDEIKEIAGFSCRRANAIIMDSVYVVAFYTDQIIPRAGPESFTGLPGMILGVALPYEHTTWFAVGFTLKQALNTQIQAPRAETVLSNAQLLDLLIKKTGTDMNPNQRGLYFHNILL